MAIHRPTRPNERSLGISELYSEDYAAIHAALTQSPHAPNLIMLVRERGDEEWLAVDNPTDLHEPDLRLSGVRYVMLPNGQPQTPTSGIEAFVVQFDAQSAYLRDPFNDVLHAGIAQQVVSILEKRRRRWKRLVVVNDAPGQGPAALGGALAVMIGITATVGVGASALIDGLMNDSTGTPGKWLNSPLPWAIGAVAVAMFLLAASVCTTTRTRLHTLTRAESPKFIERSRDDLLISAGSTAVGFFLGVVATLFLS